MLAHLSYPIVCTDKLAKSAAFFEDMLGFVPFFEMDCFLAMHQQDRPQHCIAFLDQRHPSVPPHHKGRPSGLIFNLPVGDVDAFREKLYLEGVTILGSTRNEICGRRHFMVEDPSGILIDIMQEAVLLYETDDKDKDFDITQSWASGLTGTLARSATSH